MKRFSRPGSRAALATAALLATTAAHADVLLQEIFTSGLGGFSATGSVSTSSAGARMSGSLLSSDGAIR